MDPSLKSGFPKIKKASKAPKIWGKASFGRMLYQCSKRARDLKLKVQEKRAAKLEEKVALDELAKGLEPLSEVEVASKYKTNEEIYERCAVILQEEGEEEMIEFLSKETFAKEALIAYLKERIIDIQMKHPYLSSDAKEGIETKYNNYVAFVEILEKEFQILEEHFYADSESE